MSNTIEVPRLVEGMSVTTSRRVAAFVVPGFSFKLEKGREQMATAYVGMRLMRRRSPYFISSGQVEPIGLEPYLVGSINQSLEAARFMGDLGDKQRQSMQRWLHDDHLLERAHFVYTHGDIDRRSGQVEQYMRFLAGADVYNSIAVATLKGQMHVTAQEIRDGTIGLVGDPRTRYRYLEDQGLEVVTEPADYRKFKIGREPLDQVLDSLTHAQRTGFTFLSYRFHPNFSAPVEREYLAGLRSFVS